jgi:hypothetical protein
MKSVKCKNNKLRTTKEREHREETLMIRKHSPRNEGNSAFHFWANNSRSYRYNWKIEIKQNKTKWNETKRNKTKQNETK